MCYNRRPIVLPYVGQRQEPEFEKRSSGHGGEPGQLDQKPLVLSRTIFERIRMAAKVFTAEERAKLKQVTGSFIIRVIFLISSCFIKL